MAFKPKIVFITFGEAEEQCGHLIDPGTVVGVSTVELLLPAHTGEGGGGGQAQRPARVVPGRTDVFTNPSHVS